MKNFYSHKIILFSLFIILFYNNLYSHIELISPNSQDTLIAGNTIEFDWKNDNNYPLDLYYSTDNGNSWIKIFENYVGNSYQWILPTIDSLNIQFKIEYNSFVPPYLIWEVKEAHNSEIRTAILSKDNKYVLSSGLDSYIKLWETSTKKLVDWLKFDDNPNVYGAWYYHSIDSIIIIQENDIYLWDRINSNIIKLPNTNFTDVIRSADVHKELNIISACSFNSITKIYSLDSFKIISEFVSDNNSNFYYTQFSDDCNFVISTTYDGYTYIFDWQNQKLKKTSHSHGQNYSNTAVWVADISKDNNTIISAGVDDIVKIQKLTDTTYIETLIAHQADIRSVRFHQNQEYILSAGLDSSIIQWSISTKKAINNAIINHGGQIIYADYSFTGDSIISTGRDRTIKIWKNFSLQNDYSITKCIVRYPLLISLPDTTAYPNDIINIPIHIKRIQEPQWINNISNSLNVTIKYLAKILYVFYPENRNYILSEQDSIKIELDINSYLGLSEYFIGKVLVSDNKFGSLVIDDYKLKIDTIYKVFIKNGSITVLNNCENTSQNILINKNDSYLLINPNPVKEILNIEYLLIEDGNIVLEIMNQTGEVVKTINNEFQKHGIYTLQYDISFLGSGNYYINLKTGNKIISKNFLIIR